MLLTLVKIRLKALFSVIFAQRIGSKPNSKARKIGIAVLAVYIVSMLLFSMGTMMHTMAGPLSEAGLGWLYFSIAALLAAVFSIMGTIFTIQKELFDASDNELLLSMPIPPSFILASRLVIIVVLEFMYTAIIMIPAGVVYAIYGGGLTVQGVHALVFATLLLLLLMLSIGTLFSWLASLIISKLPAKNLLTTLFMFVFIGLYMWMYSNLTKYISRLIMEGESIAAAIRKAVPPIYSYGMSIATGGLSGLAHLGLFALWCLVPFAVTYFILTRNFIKLATSSKNVARAVYRKREMKVSSGFAALVRKELIRFFTLPIYFINCAIGVILMLILSGYIAFQPERILVMVATIPDGEKLLVPGLCLALGYCALMSNIAAPSLSLEGKNLWILKAHPIPPKEIYRAKIACNLIVCLPCVVVSGAVLAFVLPLSAIEKVLVIVLPSVITFFTAVFGMAMNIVFPRFDWVNETMVVKQSASVMVAVLGGMAIGAVPAILFIPAHSVMPVELYLILCTAAFAVATAAIYAWITTSGVKRFENM